MRWITIALVLSLCACSPAPTKEPGQPANTVKADVDLELPAEPAVTPAPAPDSTPPKPQLAAAPLDLCWQDYCPCEPPQGGPDKGFCRQLKGGIPVEPEMMAAGAQMRDAREQMADFEAEHGPF